MGCRTAVPAFGYPTLTLKGRFRTQSNVGVYTGYVVLPSAGYRVLVFTTGIHPQHPRGNLSANLLDLRANVSQRPLDLWPNHVEVHAHVLQLAMELGIELVVEDRVHALVGANHRHWRHCRHRGPRRHGRHGRRMPPETQHAAGPVTFSAAAN